MPIKNDSNDRRKAAAIPKIQSYGATEVTRFASETHIVHCSKASASEKDNVQPNFDRLFGAGSFACVRPHGRHLIDPTGRAHNKPGVSYILVIPNEIMDAIDRPLPKAA